jgi:predicted acyl esterase
LELAGKGMAVYSLYGTSQEYMNGTLTGYGASYIGAIDGSALASKNPYIAAMSLGTGLGKSIVESDWYYNAVHDAPNW